MPLRTLREIPEGLLQCEAEDLHEYLDGPTLIYIEGKRGFELDEIVFISVLLHGNETSGWDGVRRYLLDDREIKRGIIVFIANIAAARQGVRALSEQQDFNRIWRNAAGSGGALAHAVRGALADKTIFAAIDMHNNTGHNPYYCVMTDPNPHNFGLALLFSDKAVYIQEPDSVLTAIFTGRCPAVTLETGPVGDPRCEDRVYDYLVLLMNLAEVPTARLDELNLYRSRVRVHVRRRVAFGFAGTEHAVSSPPLLLTGGVEAVNFHELPSGSVFGTASQPINRLLQVLDVDHMDVTHEYFENDGSKILLKQSVIPAMYTTDPYVVDQDCLCYFMERIEAS